MATMIVYYALSILTSYLLLWATYQIFLHPLSKYPGPLVAKFSDIYSAFYSYKRRLHLTTWNNQRKYGPVVRQSPNKLVFSSATAVLDIYKNDRTTKPAAYMALGPGLTTYNVFSARDKHLHRARRQLIGQALTERSMRTFEPIMIEQVDIFCRNLLSQSQSSTPANMSVQTRRLGLNIAGLLAFGYDLRLQTSDDNRFMETVMDTGTFFSNLWLQFPAGRKLRIAFLMLSPLRKLREKYLGLMENMMTSRMSLPKDAKHDLYSFVAEALDAKSDGLRQSELWGEANMFLSAAGGTVTTALSATFFYLSRNQDAYKKLAHEIRSTFASSSEIHGTALAGCTFLRACIDEAMRLSPPAPGILWRDLAPGDDSSQPFVVDGHVIPPNTVVGVNTYSLHHSEDYFPNAFAYRPERWVSSSDEEKKISREAFAPFSVGSRGCAGKAMAYLESSLVLAKSLWYFDFESASGELGEVGAGKVGLEEGRERKGEFQLYDTFSSSHDGPYLKFVVRSDNWKDLE
ncbi:Cytochrome P450 monooxygenase apf7 [Lachnellula suecica]|uniref:Cytochrome P450 monooxygenase apf7 n=1 Tax=Lachnellula suecica TaxID=602035 RepID=A0A8T9CIM8_9HELO|nr:Cytochrome P450 monooxygenase apf7 [Lachnellula suecica]